MTTRNERKRKIDELVKEEKEVTSQLKKLQDRKYILVSQIDKARSQGDESVLLTQAYKIRAFLTSIPKRDPKNEQQDSSDSDDDEAEDDALEGIADIIKYLKAQIDSV